MALSQILCEAVREKNTSGYSHPWPANTPWTHFCSINSTGIRPLFCPSSKAIARVAPSVKAVYSRSEKSVRELADEVVSQLLTTPDIYHDGNPSANLDALLARPDISTIIVVLRITLQPSIVLKSLAAGKHVISETPVAPDVASGLELIAKYEAEYKPKGLIWRVAENWEAQPGFVAAGQVIKPSEKWL